MDRPPFFFVELASDDDSSAEEAVLLRFLEEEIDPPRSLNASPRAVSDMGYSIRSEPKRKSVS